MGKTFRLRIEDCCLKPNIPAGMDPCVALGLVPLMRKTAEDANPIKVRPCGNHWKIMDGRHRFFAAVIAGRADVLAELDEECLQKKYS